MRHLFRQRLRRQVIVTLKTGEAFSGVLFDVDKELLVLRKAAMLDFPAAGAETQVDGEVLVLRQDVAYLQLP